MTDEEIFSAIRLFILSQLSNVGVVQRYQPVAEGVPEDPILLMHKIGDKRYGFPKEKDVWDEDQELFVHTHEQAMETTIQLSALQPDGETESVTASDIVNAAADILQTQEAVVYFQSLDMSILRVTDIRNPYFVDDRDRHEADPSFDFTVLHKRVKMSTLPGALKFEGNIKRV